MNQLQNFFPQGNKVCTGLDLAGITVFQKLTTKINAIAFANAAWPGSHDHQTGAHKKRFFDTVSNKKNLFMGFLPDAMINYLLRLGWGHGDTEFFSREQAIELFSLGNVGKSPARFDLEKLRGVNAHYLQQFDDAALYDLIAPHIAASSACAKGRVIALLSLLKERAKTHLDIVSQLGYLVHDGAPDMTKEARALLSDDVKSNLLKLANNLTDMSWKKNDLNSHIQRFLEDNNLKMRDIGLPLRAAITGTKQSPSIVDIMSVLGEAETLARIRLACK